MESLSCEIVLHKLLCECIPWASVLPRLQQQGSLTHRVQSFSVSRTFSLRAFHWVTASFRASTCSRMGLLHGWQVDLCIPMGLQGLQRLSCFPMVCITGCRKIGSGAWNAFSPPCPLTLVSADTSHKFSVHSFLVSINSVLRFFFPCFFLNLLKQRHYHRFYLGQPWVAAHPPLEPPQIGSTRHGGSFYQLPTEATPVEILLLKLGNAKPIQKKTIGKKILFLFLNFSAHLFPLSWCLIAASLAFTAWKVGRQASPTGTNVNVISLD